MLESKCHTYDEHERTSKKSTTNDYLEDNPKELLKDAVL